MKSLKFVGLSLLGFAFFLLPIPLGGEWKIAMSHIVGFVKSQALGPFLVATMVCAGVVALGTIVLFGRSGPQPGEGGFGARLLGTLRTESKLEAGVRIAGSLLYLVVLSGWFAEVPVLSLFVAEATGGVMAGEEGLLTTLYITFLVGLLALPLLTRFGAVEFIGVALGGVVERLFRVPGSSAVDAMASFVGDGTIGIMVTDTQYQNGYYNRREAFVIATSFSIVGIAFAAAVAEELGLAALFPLFYATIAAVTVVLAVVTSRLPLRRFPAEYFEGVEPKVTRAPAGTNVVGHAWRQAVDKAAGESTGSALREATVKVVEVFAGFLPIIMLVGTTALVIAEKTPVFQWLSAPLKPVYEWIGYTTETAAAMAPASIVGFADMYLPALLMKGVGSESAKFFIGVLAFTQLVFMSETGMVLVRSKIGFRFVDVAAVFVLRTLLSIPILALATYALVASGVVAR